MDQPLCCGKCRLYNKDYDCCQVTRNSVYPDFVDKTCPLKTVPKHVYNDKNKFAVENKYMSYQDGYNQAIDEMLRGK